MNPEFFKSLATLIVVCSWFFAAALVISGAAVGASLAEYQADAPGMGILGGAAGLLSAVMTCGPVLLFVDLWRMFREQREGSD